ncbi:flagellar hook-basal body protein [Paenibacillaceae bacterium]|nr:flagellar hook-basal body protein [Paenibacillaceae bacterium]
MLRGLYTAAAGMVTQQRRHDTVTNNIANLNTPGFKQVNAVSKSFPDMLVSLTGVENQPAKRIGVINTGVFAEESLSIHLQGDLFQTNGTLDFALSSNLGVEGAAFDGSGKYVDPESGEVTFQPQAFFTVQDRNGETRYTRDGKFSLNSEGYLVTGDNSLVLGTNNAPIRFAGDIALDNLALGENQRFVDRVTGADTGMQLLISRVENPNLLVRDGNSKLRNEGGEENVRAANAGELATIEVRQGFIERSNVDSAQSAVDLMAAFRAYEANQKIVQYYDRSLEKAVNEIGRV